MRVSNVEVGPFSEILPLKMKLLIFMVYIY